MTIAAGALSVSYSLASAATSNSDASISAPTITLDLMPLLKGKIIPGSLCFKFGSYTYIERNGVLYHSVDPLTGSASIAGSINYTTGKVVMTAWSGNSTFTLLSGLIDPESAGMSAIVGRTASAPIKAQSFTFNATALDGTAISVTADEDANLSSAYTAGYIDLETGVFSISFGETVDGVWKSIQVDPSTMKYNAVSYSYLPLDADIIGLDPVRLPQDGKVPIFREGGFAVLGNTQAIAAQVVSNGQTVDCGRVRLSRVRVIGNDGNVISTGYTHDLEAGTVSFTDVTGYAQPVQIEHRIEDMVQVSDVQINGLLTFTRPVTHVYPSGSSVSSALVAGDLKAYVSNLFDQSTWSSAWADAVSGSVATGTFNDTVYPVAVTNDGAVTERWAIVFTNTTSFNIMGEHVGVIGTGNTSTDVAPLNPATGSPYFTLTAAGWGSGWAAGNVLRFNTTGAMFPIWIIRTVQQGQESVTDDSFSLLVRGDVDSE